jgi:hypothetical protein
VLGTGAYSTCYQVQIGLKREYREGVNWTKGTVLGTEAYSTCYQVQIGSKREYREGVD